MSLEHASMAVAASPQVIRDVLLQPLAMPEWNSAFRAIDGPVEVSVDAVYSLQTAQGLLGSFWFGAISKDRIEMNWRVPGFAEHGVWEWREATNGTVVRHRFAHSGPLAALLRLAYRGVAELRLQRLAIRAQVQFTSGLGLR